MANKLQTATLGAGCYWCLEAIYQRVNGVVFVASGYSGGHIENPTISEVYSGDTGHAEVIQLTFDPNIVSYRELLEIFFVMHNPTTLNRQDYDVGELYRSVIFYDDEEQKQIALDVMNNFAADLWDDPIVTRIEPLKKFWPATEDQQNFYNNNPNYGYCQIIINPKIQKLRKEFSSKLKPV